MQVYYEYTLQFLYNEKERERGLIESYCLHSLDTRHPKTNCAMVCGKILCCCYGNSLCHLQTQNNNNALIKKKKAAISKKNIIKSTAPKRKRKRKRNKKKNKKNENFQEQAASHNEKRRSAIINKNKQIMMTLLQGKKTVSDTY